MEHNNCFDFIKYCNESITNTNEYNIAKSIISHIHDIQHVSQETIADEAHISVASVSRFITKAGFQSFQDFKRKMEVYNNDTRMRRHFTHSMRFIRTTPQDMTTLLYQDALNNLQQTYLHLDIDKLNEIVDRLKKTNSVTIVGDSHELSDFYTFQLDLLMNGIPAYLMNIKETAIINHLNKGDTIIYIDVCDHWFDQSKQAFLKKMKEQHAFIIIFAQESQHFQNYADILYEYGIEHSINDGYYSLPYLSRLLSELIYHS